MLAFFPVALILGAILFPGLLRGCLMLAGLVLLVGVLYFGSSFSEWKADCIAHGMTSENCP